MSTLLRGNLPLTRQRAVAAVPSPLCLSACCCLHVRQHTMSVADSACGTCISASMCCRWIDAGKFLTGFSAIGSVAVPAILFHAQVQKPDMSCLVHTSYRVLSDCQTSLITLSHHSWPTVPARVVTAILSPMFMFTLFCCRKLLLELSGQSLLLWQFLEQLFSHLIFSAAAIVGTTHIEHSAVLFLQHALPHLSKPVWQHATAVTGSIIIFVWM